MRTQCSSIIQPKDQSHPSFRPHLMQGWSPDFIPKLAEEVTADQRVDGYLAVDGNFSLQCAKDLAQKEGIFVGISAGATLAGAIKLAETAPEGSNILCMLPDTGERYLTTPLFEDIASEMNEEEELLSRSTPGYRFDITPPSAPEAKETVVDAAALEALATIITDQQHSIVMFALEWCEFCWSLRKMFIEYGIDFRSVDLDSVDYMENNRGGKLRGALHEKTGWNTFPQIFIKGEFVGGCTDIFGDCKTGKLQKRLASQDIAFNKAANTDPYSLLPGWLHSR